MDKIFKQGFLLFSPVGVIIIYLSKKLMTSSYVTILHTGMGIIFVRNISRLGAVGAWPEIKPGQTDFNFMAAIIYREKKLLTDFLASFTLIPGTVMHLGYGSLYEDKEWQNNRWVPGQGSLLDMKNGLFFKVSDLWRIK